MPQIEIDTVTAKYARKDAINRACVRITKEAPLGLHIHDKCYCEDCTHDRAIEEDFFNIVKSILFEEIGEIYKQLHIESFPEKNPHDRTNDNAV